MPYVSFLSDYGLFDGFVAACHGVLLCRAPGVRIIDVTHLVPAGDVRRGSVVLAQTLGHLPPAVHLAVVDPGVGTSRRAVAVATPRGFLVGPDNGLLPPAADALGGVRSVVALAVPAEVPATFHGRDVFAPAAAALVAGHDLAALGAPVDPAGLVRLPAPVMRPARPAVSGAASPTAVEIEVLTIDTFGNVQLAAAADLLAPAGVAPGRTIEITAGRSVATGLFGITFASVDPGEIVVYVDSAGLVTLAVNRGSAAQRLSVTTGDIVRLAVADGDISTAAGGAKNR
ncbi:SAM hydrolase/SAM-dependent halogenase family protein [Frankia sp. Cr2]|uniref:SAM hydrolase/SAM-dependent halogenase family protein n=1 Tax=Frankia sp. Cr2 TaxID=3073932 RepID=UPI003A101934